jgi:outer membrane usher protein
MDVNINQKLGAGDAQLFVTGSVRNYWNGTRRQVDFSAGYSNSWKSINYSLSAQRTLESTHLGPQSSAGLPDVAAGLVPTRFTERRDTRFMLNVSMPLGRDYRAPQLTAMFNRSAHGGNSTQAVVNGTFGTADRFGYNATMGHDDSAGTTLNLSGQYNSHIAQFSAGYSHGRDYRQVSGSASGSVVAHQGGVTVSPSTSETIGLIHAPNAKGARVESAQGSVVDANGYAVVPNLQPYQLNTVALDPKGAGMGLELKSTTVKVAPRARSVVLLKYETGGGRALIIDSALPDGSPLPFGADVFDAQGNSVGVVGQAGRAFVRGLEKSGRLTVRWGDGASDSCGIEVDLPPSNNDEQGDYEKFRLKCA